MDLRFVNHLRIAIKTAEETYIVEVDSLAVNPYGELCPFPLSGPWEASMDI